MIKIEANNDLVDIETDGKMDDLIGEAMCSIRSMYVFFKDHNEYAAKVFKALLQEHTKDGGAIFADEYEGEYLDEGVEDDVLF